ncbi:F-box/LRR-repeat protein 15 isoform X2 [Elgaria multicarinata webbii]|uniref:F-box/LRR-repeat protein 15 isoform X2 n=1 Tax=Elgaria multicarinata webbii TaxID=159646 RepID=UPI002FCCD9FD
MERTGRSRQPGPAGARKQFLDLPWEDVLFPHVLSYLPLKQLLSLQRVGPHFPRGAFCILLKDNEVLQQLALRNCSDWLSDKDLLPVIGQNHLLQQIELNSCVQLSRHALVAISLSCPNLRQLSLAHCEWVDSLSLRSLADHCKELESLDLTACRQLKDEAICYLAQKCNRLKSLSLAVNANVGDTAVEEIAKACPELEHLDLTGCLRVKNNSIRTLAEYCPKLRALKVKHCHDVVESSLSILRSRGVALDVEPPLQRALVLLQDVGFAPFINLQN